MRRVGLIALITIAACGPIDLSADGDAAQPDGRAETSADAMDASMVAPDATTYAREYVFTMANQAFPDSGHPGALVHIPNGFDPTQTFGVVVYVHGFKNCIENCVEDTGTSCTPGAAPRAAYNLIAQFDATNVQAVLVLPEVAFDQSTGAPGNLGLAGGLYAFLDELFTMQLAPVIGPHRVEELGRVEIVSHSGGYQVAALAATMGMVPQVREIDLLDSLYGETALFDQFVMMHVAQPAADAGAPGTWRFASVYTDTGGTDVNNRAMAMRAMSWISTPETMLWDDTYGTWTAADYVHPLLFKRTELAHDGVPRYYFREFVSASGFAQIANDAGADP